jgi:hypothetical protein
MAAFYALSSNGKAHARAEEVQNDQLPYNCSQLPIVLSSIQLISLTLMIQPRQLTPRRHSRVRKRLSVPPIAPLLHIFVPITEILDLPPAVVLCDFTDERLEN